MPPQSKFLAFITIRKLVQLNAKPGRRAVSRFIGDSRQDKLAALNVWNNFVSDHPVRFVCAITVVIGLFLLIGCGKKGPLYVPDHPPRNHLHVPF
jgi:hypothetical protein